jgi:hypothetical protein
LASDGPNHHILRRSICGYCVKAISNRTISRTSPRACSWRLAGTGKPKGAVEPNAKTHLLSGQKPAARSSQAREHARPPTLKNLDGLVALKNKYDATDFFRMNQNVKRASVYPTEALRRSDKWRFSKQ